MNNNIKAVTFMAFGKGKQTTDEVSFKKYIGVAPVKVLAVNPDKKALDGIYNRDCKEPEYVSTVVDANGNTIRQVRIDFYLQTIPEKCNGIDVITKTSFFLKDTYRQNADKTKCMIIDKYGRTAWATESDIQNHNIPMYSNGPANIDADYHRCRPDEDLLVNFIKCYLGIEDVMEFINSSWVMKPENDRSACEASLDCINDYFKGDVSEIRDNVLKQPLNFVKVVFGIAVRNDKEYQVVSSRWVLKGNSNNISKLEKEIMARKSDSETFEFTPIHEYVVTPTVPNTENNTDPFPF